MDAFADGGAAAAAESVMTQESFSDYHLYTLARKTTINNNETKQVSMLTGTGVPIRKRYLVEDSPSITGTASIRIADQGRRPGVLPVQERGARRAGNADAAGVVRVYQADSKAAQFVGEDRISHTPKDEELNLKIGNAFDVTCERNRSTSRRSRRTSTSSSARSRCAITRRRRSVEVNEPIGGTWKMVRSSHEWKKTAAWAATFAVPVAADGTVVLKSRPGDMLNLR